MLMVCHSIDRGETLQNLYHKKSMKKFDVQYILVWVIYVITR